MRIAYCLVLKEGFYILDVNKSLLFGVHFLKPVEAHMKMVPEDPPEKLAAPACTGSLGLFCTAAL